MAAVTGGDLAALVEIAAKGKSSGLEIEQPVAWLHTFREGTGPGRYLRLQVFKTRAAALEAAGLSE